MGFIVMSDDIDNRRKARRFSMRVNTIAIFDVEEAKIIFIDQKNSWSRHEVWGIRRTDNKAQILTNVTDAEEFFNEL